MSWERQTERGEQFGQELVGGVLGRADREEGTPVARARACEVVEQVVVLGEQQPGLVGELHAACGQRDPVLAAHEKLRSDPTLQQPDVLADR